MTEVSRDQKDRKERLGTTIFDKIDGPQNKDRKMMCFFILDLGEGGWGLQLNFTLSKIVA